MEHVSKKATELATQLHHPQAKTGRPQQIISEDALKVTAILWQKMTDGYQHLWFNTYGVAGGPEFTTWAKAIDTIDPKKAISAIAAILKEGHEFPPNLIKFLRLCRITTPAYFNPATLLPAPKNRNSREQQKWREAAEKLGCL